jgi:hypothetical protein
MRGTSSGQLHLSWRSTSDLTVWDPTNDFPFFYEEQIKNSTSILEMYIVPRDCVEVKSKSVA